MTSILTVILAAGQGTRMRSALPKVLHKIAGRPMVEHVIAAAEHAAPGSDIAAVYRPGMEDTAAVYAQRARACYQQEQLGTGDAVKAAYQADATDGVTVIMYADTPLIRPETVRKLIEAIENGADICVAGFTPEDAGKYGRLITGKEEGTLERIIEYNDANDEERAVRLCNSGIMAVSSAALARELPRVDNNNVKGEYYLTDLVGLMCAAGGKAAYITADESEFYGVNNRNELAYAEALFQQRKRAEFMEQGVTLIAPETVFFAADTVLGRDVVIEPHVIFGIGVSIEEGAIIKGFSHIEGACVAPDCTVGPYARLRPGADLKTGSRVGNFVEVKNSVISEGAKINHLSYIGDADVGAKVNVGAGCITCNYDGVKKYRTVIGEGAFIGSNSAMVAPLHIGANSVIGAGSAVTKDVPDNALVVARSRPVIKENYVCASTSKDVA